MSKKYALEAAVSRSYKTLDLMFPGIELDVHDEPRDMRHYITVRYTHPKLGQLRWNISVDAWALDRHDGYVEYLMRDIPQGLPVRYWHLLRSTVARTAIAGVADD